MAVVLIIGARPLSQSASRGFLELSGMGTGSLPGSATGSGEVPLGQDASSIAAASPSTGEVVLRAGRLVAFATALASVEVERTSPGNSEGSR